MRVMKEVKESIQVGANLLMGLLIIPIAAIIGLVDYFQDKAKSKAKVK